MFQLELKRCAKRETLTASQVIARRFSANPTDNGFLLLGRYERGLQNQLHRLLARFDLMQRRRPTTPWPHDEPPVPDEGQRPAWTDEKLRAQIAWFEQQERAKRTQSNPSENRSGDAESRKCVEIDAALLTKRTQCATEAGLCNSDSLRSDKFVNQGMQHATASRSESQSPARSPARADAGRTTP